MRKVDLKSFFMIEMPKKFFTSNSIITISVMWFVVVMNYKKKLHTMIRLINYNFLKFNLYMSDTKNIKRFKKTHVIN